jgi:hypothetical protein
LQNIDTSRVQRTKGTKGQKYSTKEKKIKVSILYAIKNSCKYTVRDFTKIYVLLSLDPLSPIGTKGFLQGQERDKMDRLRDKTEKVESL